MVSNRATDSSLVCKILLTRKGYLSRSGFCYLVRSSREISQTVKDSESENAKKKKIKSNVSEFIDLLWRENFQMRMVVVVLWNMSFLLMVVKNLTNVTYSGSKIFNSTRARSWLFEVKVLKQIEIECFLASKYIACKTKKNDTVSTVQSYLISEGKYAYG